MADEMKKNIDNEEIDLDVLEDVAGGKRDYGKTENFYMDPIDTFKCTVCGELTTTPFSEMSKGCPKCGGKLAMTH